MPDIFHYFTIHTPMDRVFEAISTPNGLDNWWSKSSEGNPAVGENYKLSFGPEYHWTAVVSKCTPDTEFELTMQRADSDWAETKVGFMLLPGNKLTNVRFYHSGWKESNEHYRISSYCWAMYLRILKRYLEFGEAVPYEDRLNV